MRVKVALAGVGNCASAFVQGLQYYSKGETGGLWHPVVAGLRPGDIQVVAAFDVDQRKVGLDLSKAIFASPNVARKHLEVRSTGVSVQPGILDGDVPPHLNGKKLRSGTRSAVSKALRSSGAEMLLNMISSGSPKSSEGYALAAADAGCAFVNCTPALVLKSREVRQKFSSLGLPLVGDDLMSQFGGTSFHKGLLALMVKRGVRVSKSYQLDVGGGSETLNTIDETIKMAKREVKTTSVASEVPYAFDTIAGTTDYVDYMGNDRTSYFWFQGSGFMGTGITVDIYLRSADGANAGNVLFDVVRATSNCMRSHDLKKVEQICSYAFKSHSKPTKFESAYSDFHASFVA